MEGCGTVRYFVTVLAFIQNGKWAMEQRLTFTVVREIMEEIMEAGDKK